MSTQTKVFGFAAFLLALPAVMLTSTVAFNPLADIGLMCGYLYSWSAVGSLGCTVAWLVSGVMDCFAVRT